MSAGANRKSEFFTEGRGRGFDIPERKELPATNAARTKHVEIDLNNLNHPGVGPVDFDELSRGRVLPDLTTQSGGKKTGDID